MNKLNQELQRLYFLHDQPSTGAAGDGEGALKLVSADGMARAMVVEFARASDWERVAALYQGLQEDFAWPAPAVSVAGQAGYRLWLSLAECIPVGQARVFLEALRRRYLAEIPASKLMLLPGAGKAEATVRLVPALHAASGKWSAFIDPTMGAMFADEGGLEMAPNEDRQADMLARLKSIKIGDFQRGLERLQAPPETEPRPAEALSGARDQLAGQAGRLRSTLNIGGNFTDPQGFLLAVMNDPSASAGQRIKAAKALLPYFNGAALPRHPSQRTVGASVDQGRP